MQRLRPGRVAAAHERQRLWCTNQEIRANAKANGTLLEEIAAPDNEGRTLTQAADHMKLSGRGYNRILCITRTSADHGGQDSVRRLRIAEALSYRRIAPSRQLATPDINANSIFTWRTGA